MFSACTLGTYWCGNGWCPSSAFAVEGCWTVRQDRWRPARNSTCWQSNGTFPAPRCTRWTAWHGNLPGTSQDWPTIGRRPPRQRPCAARKRYKFKRCCNDKLTGQTSLVLIRPIEIIFIIFQRDLIKNESIENWKFFEGSLRFRNNRFKYNEIIIFFFWGRGNAILLFYNWWDRFKILTPIHGFDNLHSVSL